MTDKPASPFEIICMLGIYALFVAVVFMGPVTLVAYFSPAGVKILKTGRLWCAVSGASIPWIISCGVMLVLGAVMAKLPGESKSSVGYALGLGGMTVFGSLALLSVIVALVTGMFRSLPINPGDCLRYGLRLNNPITLVRIWLKTKRNDNAASSAQ